MNKKIVLSLGVALALFSGCGGSGSGDDGGDVVTIGTGYYIDSAVAGVDYKCGSESNVTDKDGKFTFEKGKDCTFSVAGVELRKVEAEKLSDKVKIVEDKPEVAAFLQSIDIDGNVSNGIEIKPEVLTVLKEALKNHTTVPTDDNLTNVVNEVKNSVTEFKGKVVTREKAMEHVKDSQASVVKELLGGKTLYLVGQDVSDTTDVWGGKVVFDKSLKSVTYTEIFDDGETEKENFSKVEGKKIIINDNRYYIVEKRSNYISMVSYRDGNKSSNHRLYDSKDKAEAYYKSLKNDSSSSDGGSSYNDHIAITQEMLDGKIFYDSFTETDVSDPKTCYGKNSFAKTTGTRDEICYDESGVKQDEMHITYNYDIIDGKIRVDAGDEYKWFTLSSQSDSQWRMINDDDDNKDGTIDSAGEIDIWYLTKPANFPAAL